MNVILQNLEKLLWPLGALVAALLVALLVHHVLFRMLDRFARGTKTIVDDSLVRHLRRPARLIIPILAVSFLLPLLRLPPRILIVLQQTFSLLLIIAVAWLFIKLVYVFEDLILNQYDIDLKDNLEARRIHTQIQILKKVVIVVVGVLALAAALMTFEKVRQLGTTLLASAGIVGIIVGLAAQKSISTLFAGIQMAITQPIRIDDVVIVENEWGRIEEITLTYVVVRIWDLRRLIVPITYFLEKPFQNWTRISADLLGTVFLYVDYTVPVEAVRAEMKRIVESSPLWDKRVCALQVTNATERTVELRALMSAADSSSAWELRCDVREKLIGFIRQNYPDGLPKVRAELTESAEGSSKASPA
ncbi:MAG: mechanosensitive ion channel [Syntrophobacterales bacterium]|jgi:small-conductance mechanosensitive channel